MSQCVVNINVVLGYVYLYRAPRRLSCMETGEAGALCLLELSNYTKVVWIQQMKACEGDFDGTWLTQY